jgi:hypothetical protein
LGEHVEDAPAGGIADGGEDVMPALAGGWGHCFVIMCKVRLTCQARRQEPGMDRRFKMGWKTVPGG